MHREDTSPVAMMVSGGRWWVGIGSCQENASILDMGTMSAEMRSVGET